MKRFGNLWHRITDFSNLLLAARKAQKGERFRPTVLSFNYELEQNLTGLKFELESKTYKPGNYKTFEIFEPKYRVISAAPYRDRVIHHALCNIIVPLVEPSFTEQSYANRTGFGTHRALRKFRNWAHSYKFVLQCDLQKYFPSIDHEILKEIIRKKIKCADTLWLMDSIIDGSNVQIPAVFHFPGDDLVSPLGRRRGLPIGNLTSQFFANWYLNSFDHFVMEELKAKRYARYVDDFAIFSNDRNFLVEARLAMEDFLAQLRLKIHPIKSQITETRYGATFLGFRVYPDYARVRSDNLRRAKQRYRQLQEHYRSYKANLPEVVQCLQSWEAHLKHGDTHQLRRQVFDSLVFSRSRRRG
jgi:retron-type reverse transcriptase